MVMARTKSADVHRALCASATTLFAEQGISATGIEEIAGHAKAGKPAIYRHFGSKAGLVLATLQLRHRQRRADLERTLERAEPGGHIPQVVEWIAAWIESDEFAGCAFHRAAGEPAVVDDAIGEEMRGHKRWLRSAIETAATNDGLADERMGQTIYLLIEGAAASALIDGPEAAEHLRAATRLLRPKE